MADSLGTAAKKRSTSQPHGLTPAEQKRLDKLGGKSKKTPSISSATAQFVDETPQSVPLPALTQFNTSATSHSSQYTLIRPQRQDFSGFIPAGMFDVNTSLALLPESEYQTKLEMLKSEQRWASIATERQVANQGWMKAQGAEISTQTEVTKNEIKLQNWQTEEVRLQQAQTKTGIEQAKLSALGHDLNGYQQEAVLKGQAWQAKLMSLRADVTYALEIAQQKEQQLSQISPFRQ